jgi:hypothetical protein
MLFSGFLNASRISIFITVVIFLSTSVTAGEALVMTRDSRAVAITPVPLNPPDVVAPSVQIMMEASKAAREDVQEIQQQTKSDRDAQAEKNRKTRMPRSNRNP